jgi:hypothetical protein
VGLSLVAAATASAGNLAVLARFARGLDELFTAVR